MGLLAALRVRPWLVLISKGSSAIRSSSISGLMSITASEGSSSISGLTVEVSLEEFFSKVPLLIINMKAVCSFAVSIIFDVKDKGVYSA